MNVKATCDNIMSVWVDGESVVSDRGVWPPVAFAFQMTKYSRVIAIQCEEISGEAGILASDDGGLITDASWRCSRTPQAGWQQADFTENPDIWENADEYGTNENSHYPFIVSGINLNAKWIWYGSNNGDPGTVYCRKDLSEGNIYYCSPF